jgi:hypothetical protein
MPPPDVPVPPGVCVPDVPGAAEGEPVVVPFEGGVVVVVGGDADGLRSPGPSPTRSDFDSVHPVRTLAPSATAHSPMSTFFIVPSSS